ncbi:MAG: hypothetical protein Ct9H300mP11_24370 [Chloroflexota bacterium]|nr:MAG: hypothetical protein Ct9H300mP11_24370 [Chloroflexota bacterium]
MRDGDDMQQIVDWPSRMKEVAKFVGLDQQEFDVIESTRELVLAKGEEITASVYDHFFCFLKLADSFLKKWRC